MIIHDFNVVSVSAFPSKANPPPIIDPNTMLSGPVTFQRFQSVTWRRAEIVDPSRLIQHQQLSPCYSLDIRRQPSSRLVIKQPLSFAAGETSNHTACIR